MSENQGNPVDTKAVEAPAAPAGGFARSLYEIFTDPAKVFARIDAGLSWWKPFIVLCAITMVIGYLITPYRNQAMKPLFAQMPPERAEQALENMGKFGWIGLLVVPVFLVITYLILAAIAHVVINIMSTRSSFKKTLSLIAWCAIVATLEQIISTVVIMSRGVESIETMADLRMSIGPAALAPNATGFVAAFLQSLSVFQIWYYVLLVLGISAVFRMSRTKAIAPVVPIWLISVILLMVGSAFGGMG